MVSPVLVAESALAAVLAEKLIVLAEAAVGIGVVVAASMERTEVIAHLEADRKAPPEAVTATPQQLETWKEE